MNTTLASTRFLNVAAATALAGVAAGFIVSRASRYMENPLHHIWRRTGSSANSPRVRPVDTVDVDEIVEDINLHDDRQWPTPVESAKMTSTKSVMTINNDTNTSGPESSVNDRVIYLPNLKILNPAFAGDPEDNEAQTQT